MGVLIPSQAIPKGCIKLVNAHSWSWGVLPKGTEPQGRDQPWPAERCCRTLAVNTRTCLVRDKHGVI